MYSTGTSLQRKIFTSNSCALLSLIATHSQVEREKLTGEGASSQVRIPFFTGKIERVPKLEIDRLYSDSRPFKGYA